jgi:hypothetical protein
MYYILYNRVRFRYNKGSGTFPTKASITGVVQIFWSHTALDSSNVRMSRQGGKLKPLKVCFTPDSFTTTSPVHFYLDRIHRRDILGTVGS